MLKTTLFEYIYRKKLQGLRWLVAPIFFGQHVSVVEYLVRHYAGNQQIVLDLGARRSPYTHSLKGHIIGLDLPAKDDSKLGFNPENVATFTRNKHWPVFGFGEYLPFEDNTVDTVLMIEVIEHIYGDEKAVKEIRRVLKPGGTLVLTTPNGQTFPIPTPGQHVRHYTPEALKSLVGSQLEIEHFWAVFPDGIFWRESVRSVRTMIVKKRYIELLYHCLAIWIYWVYTAIWFIIGNGKNTATLCLVARKA